MKIILEIERKFNGGSHIFNLSFNNDKEANSAIKALELSPDIIRITKKVA